MLGTLLMLGGCGAAPDQAATTNSASAATAPVNVPTDMNAADTLTPPDAEAADSQTLSDANVAKAATIVKDQFFPDEVDHSGSASYQKEWWMVKGAVKQAGYPCAAVALVQQQLNGTFKAVCKAKLHTNKYDAFVIDPDAQTVVPLS